MAKLMNSILTMISFSLVATVSLSNAQVVVSGTGLTCSNPSPLPNNPPLSGAQVTLFCLGARRATINTTFTNGAGDFIMTAPMRPELFPLLSCSVFANVPADCTIGRLFGRVRTLISSALIPMYERVPVEFEATMFRAYN